MKMSAHKGRHFYLNTNIKKKLITKHFKDKKVKDCMENFLLIMVATTKTGRINKAYSIGVYATS